MFSSSSVVDGSLPSPAGELHPRLQDSQCHPLILDGSVRLRPLRDYGETVCACTFYLVFKEPAVLLDFLFAFPRRGRRAPLQQYFLQGNLAILPSAHPSVNFFLVGPSIFSSRRFRGPSRRIKATHPPLPVFGALDERLGSCELKEVSAGKCRRRVTLGSTQYTRPFRCCQLRQMPEDGPRMNPRN